MQWINDNTCFIMRKVASREQAREPFITFSSGPWCQSFVGRITEREQFVAMVPGCGTVGTIIHEFLHALGFHHEQSRSDRDEYVRIDLDNVQSSAKYNFATSDTDNFAWPYIYGSVMAYPGTAFAKDYRKQTIFAEDEKFQRSMGWRVTGSFADSRRINTAYKCIDKCKSGPKCQHGGYCNPKNCNVCMCPEAFTGQDCGSLKSAVDPSRSNRGCGGVIQLNKNEQNKQIVINTKSTDAIDAHYCYYEIKAPVGKTVNIRWVKEGDDQMPCSGGCNYGFIEMNPGKRMKNGQRDYGIPGFRDCCANQLDTSPIVTDSNAVIVTSFARQNNNVKVHVYASVVGGNGGGNGGGNQTKGTYEDYLDCYEGCSKQYQQGGKSYNWVIKCSKDCEQIMRKK